MGADGIFFRRWLSPQSQPVICTTGYCFSSVKLKVCIVKEKACVAQRSADSKDLYSTLVRSKGGSCCYIKAQTEWEIPELLAARSLKRQLSVFHHKQQLFYIWNASAHYRNYDWCWVQGDFPSHCSLMDMLVHGAGYLAQRQTDLQHMTALQDSARSRKYWRTPKVSAYFSVFPSMISAQSFSLSRASPSMLQWWLRVSLVPCTQKHNCTAVTDRRSLTTIEYSYINRTMSLWLEY